MKKNISINLQGLIFHIEDDGYDVLSRYLYEVKAHFASYQGHEEIVADIEGRIAELFSARLSASKQVITLTDVEEMTAKMGRVSDFAAADEEELEAEPAATASGSRPTGSVPPLGADGQPRRLYRDLAHRKIAGVCAGLAQYFMVNPLVVRLVFVLVAVFTPAISIWENESIRGHLRVGSWGIIAYIILWIVLPKRDDAPEPIDTLSSTGPLAGRKLFRDVDAGKVGGVAAGLAAYFRTDVVLVRVLFLLGTFLFGSTVIVYIVLWIVVPEARTVSEKMQMRGDAVTLSGIDNSLRAGAFDFEGAVATGSRSVGTFLEGAARSARPAASFLGTVIRWIVGGLLIFWGGSWLFSVLVMLGAALSIIPFTALEHTRNGFMFDDSFGAVARNLPPWGAVAGGLFMGIPGPGMMLLGMRLILRRPVLGRTASAVLLGLWLLGLVGSVAASLQVAREFQAKDVYTTTVRLTNGTGPGIVLDSRNVEDHFQWVDLNLAPADSGAAPFVEEEFRARGRTEEAARLTAQQTINYNITQRDSTITFDQGTTLKSSAVFRDQKLSLTLHLPLDKIYSLTPLFVEHLDDRDFTSGHRPSGNRTYRARFTREGKFDCLNCPPSDDDDNNARDQDNDRDEVVNIDANGKKMQVRVNTNGDVPTVRVRSEAVSFNTDPGHYGRGRKATSSTDEFSEVEIQGPFKVVLRQGDTYKVEAAGRPADLADVRLDIRGSRLVVRNRVGGGLFSGFDASQHPILVQITMPRLQHLDLSGAAEADASGFHDEELRLEVSAASSARLDVNVPRLEVKISSASRLDLSGTATELDIDGSSASEVEALALRADRVALDLSSASQAHVHANEELKADLSSGSSASYAGHPGSVQKDLSSGSSLEEAGE